MSTDNDNSQADDAQEAPQEVPEHSPKDTTPPFASFKFTLEGDALTIHLTPHTSESPLNKILIQEALKEQTFESLAIDDDAIKQAVALHACKDPVDIKIGERQHAEASLVVGANNMSCLLTIISAVGGNHITDSDISELIDKHGIAKERLNQTNIKEAIEKSQAGEFVSDVIIAEGVPAENGKNTEFVVLIELPKENAPTLQEDGTTDYFETHQYPSIEEGTELMRKEPPTSGTDGIDVFGKKLKATPGKAVKFAKCEGAHTASGDDHLLIAEKKGHPVIAKQGVSVSDTLELSNVDLSSGNIHFDGSISITGNVNSRMVVEASGDINIRGFVENATIVAGNNIMIGAGVISEQVQNDDEEEVEFTSTLKAGGNIQAMFFNQTDARANGDISVKQYAMNSRLIANHNIIIGDGGGKGVLLGGFASAGESINVNTLGSSAYVKTEVQCASTRRLESLQANCEEQYARRIKELNQLQSFMEKVGGHDAEEKLGKVLIDKTKKIQLAINKLTQTTDKLSLQIDELKRLLEESLNSSILINRKLYPNCFITIADMPYKSHEERNKTTLHILGDTVSHE